MNQVQSQAGSRVGISRVHRILVSLHDAELSDVRSSDMVLDGRFFCPTYRECPRGDYPLLKTLIKSVYFMAGGMFTADRFAVISRCPHFLKML